jgi:hypothetical protein
MHCLRIARDWMFAFVAIGCLSACQSSTTQNLAASTAFEKAAMMICDRSMERLVRYANEIDNLDGEELSNAQRQATDRFTGKPSYINRMKLALVLAHPNADPGQRDRGVELLRGALATDLATTSNEKAFARFLYTFLASRTEQVSPELKSTRTVNAELKNRQNRLDEQLQEAREALVEQHRERQLLEWQLKEERRERRTLKWQLEALKQLEETIHEREGSDEESSQ